MSALINNNSELEPNSVTWILELDERYMMAEFATNNDSINRATNFDEFDASVPFHLTFEPVLIDISIGEFDICNEDSNCYICWEEKIDSQICQLNCNHKFCHDCTLYYVKNYNQKTCPLCREVITIITVKNQEIYEKFI